MVIGIIGGGASGMAAALAAAENPNVQVLLLGDGVFFSQTNPYHKLRHK